MPPLGNLDYLDAGPGGVPAIDSGLYPEWPSVCIGVVVF